VVSIPACHAGDPGSIPGRGAFLFFCILLHDKAYIIIFIINLSNGKLIICIGIVAGWLHVSHLCLNMYQTCHPHHMLSYILSGLHWKACLPLTIIKKWKTFVSRSLIATIILQQILLCIIDVPDVLLYSVKQIWKSTKNSRRSCLKSVSSKIWFYIDQILTILKLDAFVGLKWF
jgi:hypothetical protein